MELTNKFSPALITTILVEPLRYFFANYTSAHGLVWSEDDKKCTIEIGAVNDFNKVKVGAIPRILISRGSFGIDKTGLSDSMSHSNTLGELHGLSDRTNKIFIKGSAAIVIEARNEGTCELITDMVSHFIVWSRPILCSSMGFKDFGLPMQVSEAEVSVEDTEKFKVTLQFPYLVEENWRVNNDALLLKGYFTTLSNKL